MPEVEDGILKLGLYESFLPVADPPLATVELTYDYPLVAAVADRVFMAQSGGVTSYRVAGLGISAAGPPPAPVAIRIAPNPFNARMEIALTMGKAGTARAAIHDLRGHLLRTLEQKFPVGPASLVWDGRDGDGRDLPSGIYLIRVTQPSGVALGRCALVR